jgi:FkbM family methyltransferase
MEINYFDFGLHKGDEIDMFLNAVKPLGADVCVFGFEPYPDLYDKVSLRYAGNLDIQILPYAVSDKNEIIPLYIAESNKMEGNSIFSSKNNVDADNYVNVQAVRFSDYINTIDYKDCINVIRFNIEGAEIHLFEDIISSGLNNHIDLYLGARGGVDILKVSEISHLHSSYENKLRENGIEVHQFCSVSQDNISSEKICSILQSANNEK